VPITRLDDFLVARDPRPGERYLVKVDVEGGERQVLEGFLPLLGGAAAARLQVEVIHASDADRAWMIEHFYLHLISIQGLVPVPVNSVRDYHRLLSSGRFYALDAVLSTEILADGFEPTADGGGDGHGRDDAIVRAENAAMSVIRERELQATTRERDRAQQMVRALHEENAALMASHSWRLTAPLRAMSGAIRRALGR
jgi:hypothetical protein